LSERGENGEIRKYLLEGAVKTIRASSLRMVWAGKVIKTFFKALD